MVINLKDLLPYVFALLFAGMLFFDRCREGDTIKEVTVRVDTVKGSVTFNDYTVNRTTAGKEPKNPDTVFVYLDYDSVRTYEKTFSDSVISGTVNLSVFRNRLQSFDLKYKALSKTTTITQYKPTLYLGGTLDTKGGYGPMLIYSDKTKSYMGGYNFQDKSIQVGLAIKIK